MLTSLEICAGGGGQALGLERAGFRHVALIENDPVACDTLRQNRPGWNVVEADVRRFDGTPFLGKVDLLAGGVPCPPFSAAGKQLGEHDERNLFTEAIRLVREIEPRAVMLENVRGLLSAQFAAYRELLGSQLEFLGYVVEWRLLEASDYGVPQLRPRTLLLALRPEDRGRYSWPLRRPALSQTVGEALFDAMSALGWEGAQEWARKACEVAPTLVGGSHKHGGPDLGPTRARLAWAKLGVDGIGLADMPPGPGFRGMPRLTVEMAAILQGFPAEWRFAGGKTRSYRQVGNAFPPQVAQAVGHSIFAAIAGRLPVYA